MTFEEGQKVLDSVRLVLNILHTVHDGHCGLLGHGHNILQLTFCILDLLSGLIKFCPFRTSVFSRDFNDS